MKEKKKEEGKKEQAVSRLSPFFVFSLFASSFFLLLSSFAAPAAQQQAPRPTFRSGVDLVAVDVQVVDRDGKPIPALTTADFDVRFGGRKRTVVTADLVSYDAGIAGKAAPPAVARIASAVPTPGRLFIVAVDEGGLVPGDAMVARDAARRFLKKLSPGDYVGVFKVPIFERVLDLTKDHEAASKVFDRIVGSYVPFRGHFNMLPSEIIDINAGDRDTFSIVVARECDPTDLSCPGAVQNEARIFASYAEAEAANRVLGLRLLLDKLQEMPDRKTLILISGGMISSDHGAARPDVTNLMLQLGMQAAAANTSLYVLHVDGSFFDGMNRAGWKPQPPGAPPLITRSSRDGDLYAMGLERLADAARGGYIRIQAGTPDYAFDRVLRETSAYYLLAVAPEDRDRTGRLQFLRVGVNAKGATVRSKSHVFIPKK
jgi:VWFA-related protein